MAAINLRDYSKTAAQRGWGVGWPSCGGAKAAGTAVVTADRSGVRFSVHKRIARLVDLIVDECERRGYLLKQGQVGGYNCRAIGGTSSPSNHSWGLAIDINWLTNPMRNPLTTDFPPWMVELFNRYGFAWGGHYTSTRDAMHMEFMGTPEQADEMTALALRELTVPPLAPAPTPPAAQPAPSLPRALGDDAMYIKCQPDPKKPAWVAILSGPMFVGLSTPGELQSAEGEIRRGAICQWVEAHTWMDLDRRSHALCDNPRPVVATTTAAPTRSP